MVDHPTIAYHSLPPTTQQQDNECLHHTVQTMRRPPHLAIVSDVAESLMRNIVPAYLPRDCVIAGLESHTFAMSSEVNFTSILLGSFPQAQYHPFALTQAEITECLTQDVTYPIMKRIYSKYPSTPPPRVTTHYDDDNDNTNEWKLVILYCTGTESYYLEQTIHEIQQTYPQATLVGGTFGGGYISLPIPDTLEQAMELFPMKDSCDLFHSLGYNEFLNAFDISTKERFDELIQHHQYYLRYFGEGLEGGIWGVGISGDIPFHVVTSLGVEPNTLTLPNTTAFSIAHSQLLRTHDPYRKEQDADCTLLYHSIHSVRNDRTNQVVPIIELMKTWRFPVHVGLPSPDQDGFELRSHFSYDRIGGFLLPNCFTCSKSITGYKIDFFRYTEEASLHHLQATMEHVSSRLPNRSILGAVMVCGASRRITRLYLGDAMVDLRRLDMQHFSAQFPTVPLLVVNAHVTISPTVVVGSPSRFQNTHLASNISCAVAFLVFTETSSMLLNTPVDDSVEAIAEFMKAKVRKP
jgi:hypothetical protein